MSGRIVLLAALTLLPIAVVQAEPTGLPLPEEGQTPSTARPRPYSPALDSLPDGNADEKTKLRSDSRYGIGYEARHGADGRARGQRDDRLDRPERVERGSREH